MKKQYLIVVVVVVLIAMLGVGQALAAGTWYNYNLTLPKFGFGSAITNNKTNQYSGNAKVNSVSVGGNYTVKVRMENLSNSGCSPYYTINDGTLQTLTINGSTCIVGNSAHDRFRNHPTTIVDVQVIGCWSPDTPTSSNCP